MLIALILVIAAIGFYLFIGLAPKELAQLMLASLWALMVLGTVASMVSALFL